MKIIRQCLLFWTGAWPVARERIKTVCRQILDATREPKALPELRDATVREIVTNRAERMLGLMEKTAG
jgi:hypothetical protein